MTTISPERLGFFEITPQDFQHPADEAALDTLKKARGIDWITKKVMELGFERIVRMQLIADSLKVSSQQCPSLFNMFHECCSILDISAIPEFFIECNPYPNAYTTGFTNPVVVVSSGLLEIVDDDELRFILGHELGHVKCGHVLYQSMAEYLRIILEQIGNVTLGIGRYIGKGLELSFLLWSRKAEFTADRSGLLTCQKDDVAVKGLMKIAAPIDKIWNEVSVESIMEQAETFEELSEDTLSKVYKFFFGIQRTHPWLVLRTKEVKEWAASDEYTHLLKSGASLEELAQKQRIRFDTVFSTSAPSRPKFCTNCGQPLNKTIKFCGYCGVSVG
jgi:Zn-dependent protease with chaperone function